MIGISRPVVKHGFLVKKAKDIQQVMKKAFYLAAARLVVYTGGGPLPPTTTANCAG